MRFRRSIDTVQSRSVKLLVVNKVLGVIIPCRGVDVLTGRDFSSVSFWISSESLSGRRLFTRGAVGSEKFLVSLGGSMMNRSKVLG